MRVVNGTLGVGVDSPDGDEIKSMCNKYNRVHCFHLGK